MAMEAQLYALETDSGVFARVFVFFVLIYDVYGWTNGAHNKSAAERTDDHLSAIIEDIRLQPPGPVMVLGDFNAEPQSFKTFYEEVKDNKLIDLGFKLHGGEASRSTTLAKLRVRKFGML